MTFDTDERSASGSRPIDLYSIASPSGTYYLTSNVTDIAYGGVTYVATTMSRGVQQLAQDLTGKETIVYLPISHPVVQRFAASGIPEQEVIITISRLQTTSSIAAQTCRGFAQSISIDGHVAMIRVPSLTDDAMKIRLPTIALQKLCNHVLYDERCTVNRTSASGTANITAIAGNTVTTNSLGSGTLFVYGDILHSPSGQRRMVTAQSGSVLTLNAPIFGAAIGDAVVIAPGCDHTVTTCRDKFSNVINYGGHPQMNAAFNPWLTKGLGITQQV